MLIDAHERTSRFITFIGDQILKNNFLIKNLEVSLQTYISQLSSIINRRVDTILCQRQLLLDASASQCLIDIAIYGGSPFGGL